MLTHASTSPRSPARVVVLGASGFVGRHMLVTLAGAGIPTVALGSRDLDLLDPGSVNQLRAIIRKDDAVLMISALTPDKGRDAATLMKNMTMVHHLGLALAEAPCGHLVYFSSDAAYEDAANPVRETTPRHPSSLYGLMHVAREGIVQDVARVRAIPCVILRLAGLFGVGDTHNSYGPNRFLRSALAGGGIALSGHGEEKRDHVFIGDTCRLVLEVLRHGSTGVLNIATGHSRSFLEVAEAIAGLLPGVTIETTPRTVPIIHRHFDVVETVRAFPTFAFTPFADAMRDTVRATAIAG